MEGLLADNYEVVELRQSKYDPERKLKVVTGMRCPRCKFGMPKMDHGEKRTCPKCNLGMRLYGNALNVWDSKTEKEGE